MEAARMLSSEEPSRQIWAMLRLFLDATYTAERIRDSHDLGPNDNKQNVAKQARQVAYCVRQAEEYFKASTQVTLVTRPLMLYYGAVALSRALVLVKLSGESSFDALRSSGKHRHHGLDLAGEFAGSVRPGDSAIAFLRSMQTKVHFDKNPPTPWGHFALFYKSLQPTKVAVRGIVREGEQHPLITTLAFPGPSIAPLTSFQGRTLNVLDLIESLPDISPLLLHLGHTGTLRRGEIRLKTAMIKESEDGHSHGSTYTYEFCIYGVPEPEQIVIQERLRVEIPEIEVVVRNPHAMLLRQKFSLPTQDGSDVHLPDYVDDIGGTAFFVVKPEGYMAEPAAMFVALFCLGMACRYYPDCWVRALDDKAHAAEIANTFLDVVERKFPHLILDQLMGVKHSFLPLST